MTTLRAFLSSTSVDLRPYRTRIASLVESLGQFAVTMDRFPLRPDLDAITVSLDELHASDLYILILAWRYGTIPDGHMLSVTHEEYREARRLNEQRRAAGQPGLPCFVFLAADTTEKDTDQFLLAQRDSEHYKQLLAFRAEVQQHLVGAFVSLDDLVDRVAAALNRYLIDLGRTPHIPHDLPPQVPGFVGRADELAQLTATLQRGQSVGLSALVAGLGGVGKSALASEVLHQLPDDAFPGGVTWVQCDKRTGLEGLNWVYDQVLAAWGVPLPPEALRGVATPEAEVEVREQALRDWLHPPSAALVLLDNVEVDFPLDRALQHLTPQHFTLLVTARHQPSLPGLRLLSLDVLETEAAVQLFAERYSDRGGTWDVARDETATQTVVETLGRLPLAIELAAARAALTGMSVSGLADELAQPGVLARLRDPLDDAARVRYSFERSLALLTPARQVRFAALGLPDGPDWPRSVMEALLEAVPPDSDPGTAGVDLERLAALSLVRFVAMTADGTRVWLHPLLRMLAAEQWTQQPASMRQAGLVGLMAGVRAWAQAHQTHDAASYALLEADEALVVGALQQASAAGVARAAVVDTAFLLYDYFIGGGHWRAGIDVWTLARQAARAKGDRANEGACFLSLGVQHWRLGERDQARACYEQALDIARALGDRQGESSALLGLGDLATERGDCAQARRSYDLALAIDRRMGDRVGESRTLNSLGILAYEQGDLAAARDAYEQALAIHRQTGDRAGEAGTLGNLAELALAADDLARAHHCLDPALTIVRPTGNRIFECSILIQLAELARHEGRWDDAQQVLDEASAVNRTLGSREYEARVLAGTARLRRDQGHREAAREAFAQALAIFEALGLAFETQRVRAELAALDAPTPTATKPAPKPKRRWPWRR
jgi:tetratricopeptide (TPR) repeat protein